LITFVYLASDRIPIEASPINLPGGNEVNIVDKPTLVYFANNTISENNLHSPAGIGNLPNITGEVNFIINDESGIDRNYSVTTEDQGANFVNSTGVSILNSVTDVRYLTGENKVTAEVLENIYVGNITVDQSENFVNSTGEPMNNIVTNMEHTTDENNITTEVSEAKSIRNTTAEDQSFSFINSTDIPIRNTVTNVQHPSNENYVTADVLEDTSSGNITDHGSINLVNSTEFLTGSSMVVDSGGLFIKDKCMNVAASVNCNTTSAKLSISSDKIRSVTRPRPCPPGEARDFEGKCRPIW
jgi:hypothetical protein